LCELQNRLSEKIVFLLQNAQTVTVVVDPFCDSGGEDHC
jgi:hypothetical protein